MSEGLVCSFEPGCKGQDGIPFTLVTRRPQHQRGTRHRPDRRDSALRANEPLVDDARQGRHCRAFALTVDPWDWQAGQYDLDDAATAAMTTQYGTVESIMKGDITRYVEAGNAVRARLRVKPTGPTASLNWCVDFDQAVWNAVPRP